MKYLTRPDCIHILVSMKLKQYIKTIAATGVDPYKFLAERMTKATGNKYRWWTIREKLSQKSMNVQTAILIRDATDGLVGEHLEDFII